MMLEKYCVLVLLFMSGSLCSKPLLADQYTIDLLSKFRQGADAFSMPQNSPYVKENLSQEGIEHLHAKYTAEKDSAELFDLVKIGGDLVDHYCSLKRYKKAKGILIELLKRAKGKESKRYEAKLYNDLARVYVFNNDSRQARKYYSEAKNIAVELNDNEILINVILNQILLEQGLGVEKERIFGEAEAIIKSLNLSESFAYRLQLAKLAKREFIDTNKRNYLLVALNSVTPLLSEFTGDENYQFQYSLLSELYALSGELYLYKGVYLSALNFIKKALTLSELAGNLTQTYRWYWLLALTSIANKDNQSALAYYDLAVEIHHTLFVSPDTNKLVGLQEKLYNSYIKLLLSYSDQDKLKQVIVVLERLRTAELQDYFKESCSTTREYSYSDIVANLRSGEAIFYPVIMNDRIELLLLTSKKIYRRYSSISKKQLLDNIRHLRTHVTNANSLQYIEPAKYLYGVLIKPIENILSEYDIDHLVIVPDYLTSAIPFSALLGSDKFLVERIGLSITPSMSLTSKFDTKQGLAPVRPIYAGISIPIKNFPALPNVETELSLAHSHIPGVVLLNQDFTVSKLTKNFSRFSSNLLHISAHVDLKSDINTSYMQAYNEKISMNLLRDILVRKNVNRDPISLLVLSACSTAVGDNKAALGFAGLAVKSGAQSTIASLWAVYDEPTARLMGAFYARFAESNQTRYSALRAAQLTLLHDPIFQHPSHWSGFTLIGRWR